MDYVYNPIRHALRTGTQDSNPRIVAATTGAANVDLVKRLGADIVIDYKKDDFDKRLHDYDVVLNSLGTETLYKSLGVLKPGHGSSRSLVRLIPILRKSSG